MTIFPGKNRGPAGRADTVGAKTVVKTNSIFSQSVDLRRFVNFAAITTDGVDGMIVTHDE